MPLIAFLFITWVFNFCFIFEYTIKKNETYRILEIYERYNYSKETIEEQKTLYKDKSRKLNITIVIAIVGFILFIIIPTIVGI
ncbi:hypothetical protein [Peptostreptococcus faecalis]|uniref:hypothetical protein n=1 Tax=Peptostreptococcus faecalis TaxID=2045015 RepID=UPI000C79ADD7|nr:hypothetical protein [Peptostreptococcus faecalis]